MKETIGQTYCGECLQDFKNGDIAHYTWYENRFFCDKCKEMMNSKVTPAYLNWEQRKVVK